MLEAIAFYIQSIKPELIPRPPYGTTTDAEIVASPAKPAASKPKSSAKGKGKAKDKAAPQPVRTRLPQPPEPQPPLASRVSSYSPALPSGVLVDTVKAGLNAAAADNAAAPPGMTGKGKRKVVRVRG